MNQHYDFLSPSLNWIEMGLFAGFALMGGLLGYLMRQAGKQERPYLYNAAIEGLSAGFVGVMMMLICKASGIDWMWSVAIVGVFSWLGAEATVMMISKTIRRKLGLDGGNDGN